MTTVESFGLHQSATTSRPQAPPVSWTLLTCEETAMKRYLRFDKEAPLAVEWSEWTGQQNTRQITLLRGRWICSLDGYVRGFGPPLADFPLSDLDLGDFVEITPEEFERMWECGRL